MSPVWDADNEISAEMAPVLIARQFPVLAPVHVAPLGVGWDNAAFLVNEDTVFRFPRRKLAAGLLGLEMRILPLLASFVPLPIPVPEFHGRPDGDYPYEFVGYRMIPGATACKVNWSDAMRAANAVPLAGFLSALHSIPIGADVQVWAPGDEIRRADVRWRAPKVRERLGHIADLAPESDLAEARDWVDQLADTPLPEGPACWTHGDLYARHLLVDAEEQLCGVIDWGDVHLGDRALDLSIVYSFLPQEARPLFWQEYGEVDELTLRRARFRAISYGALLTEYGADVGDAAILRVGLDALRLAVR